MRLSLLSGSSPHNNRGPHVKIPKGVWRLVHNATSSVLSLMVVNEDNGEERMHDDSTPLNGPAKVYITIKKPGSEKHLLVYLEGRMVI